MDSKGILIVTANPPIHMEAEFNAWYDLEHLPERMAVPGFESGKRYVQLGVARRYLALYDLARVDILQSDAYLAVSGDKATPWTKRIVEACRFRRDVATQVFPGTALASSSPSLLYARIEGAESGELVRLVAANDEPTTRIFEGRGDSAGSHFLTVNGIGQLDALLKPLLSVPGITIEMTGTYVAY